MSLLPIFFATGLVAGTIDAIAGGGGLISLPMLLSLGLPPSLALGTNKLQSLCGTAVAAFSYYRHGWLQPRGLLRGVVFTILGALLGAGTAELCSNEFLKRLIPFLLLLVFSYVSFCPRRGQQDEQPKVKESLFYPLAGLALGFYDGFLGPGVGGFWVFLLMYFLGFNLLKATAYTKVFNLNSNIVAVLCFAMMGQVDYRIGFVMAVGQVLGAKIGAQFAMRKGVRWVRPLFLFMMLAAIVTLLYRDHSQTRALLQGGFALVFLGMGAVYFWNKKKPTVLREGG